MLFSPPSRPSCLRCALRQQIRHATLIRRPKRPYTFTQLITLSDGSTFLHRTTSPQPVYRSTKDTKNTAMWNPSSQKLLNVEEDEAGRLRRFRKRFGRGFDAEAVTEGQTGANEGETGADQDESLLDLLSSYGQQKKESKPAAGSEQGKMKAETKGEEK